MIVRVNYKTISREVINALSAGAMELEHVKALRKNVEEYAGAKKKGFITALIMMVVIFAVMFGAMIMSMSKNGPIDYSLLMFIMAPIVIVIAIGMLLGGWLSFGRIKSQYNTSLKKGYPQMYEELKL